MKGGVLIRPVIEADLPIFFEHQQDPDAVAMAAFPARERAEHLAHWAKIMANRSNMLRTIVSDGKVAGNIVCWDGSDGREVGYWLGKEYWGQGIATIALGMFLKEVEARPLYAHVAKHNLASRRVLEKCGFIVTGVAAVLSTPTGDPIAELMLRLD